MYRTRQTGSLRRKALAILVVVVLLSGFGVAYAAQSTPLVGLMLADGADHSNIRRLAHSTVSGGEHIFIANSSTTAIESVSYFFDDGIAATTPTVVSTAPFDIGIDATALGDGTHSLLAVIKTATATHDLFARFAVHITTVNASGHLYLGAVARTDLVDDAAYTNAYRTYHFDSVTPQDVMTFKVTEPEKGQYDWSGADKLINWAQANNLRVRGHNLLWYADIPDWVKSSSNEEVTAAVKAHIQAEVGRYKGKVAQWDVVNEGIDDLGGPRADDVWRQKLGPDYIAMAFQWAHEADPSAQLYYNEYHIESTKESEGSYAGKWSSLIEMIKDFKSRNIPIDGIGFQAHSQFGSMGTGPEILVNVQAIGALGLHVEMTEVDVRDIDGTDETAHAARFAEIGKACKDSNGICTGVTTWGLNDAQAYVPAGTNALTFYDDLTPKPSYYALIQAMQ